MEKKKLPAIPPITIKRLYTVSSATPEVEKVNQPPPVTIIGEDTQTGQEITIDDVSRCSGCYIIGTQGAGKSSLLEHMIYQDIEKNYAVFVLDPHGQLCDNIISRMSKNHLRRCYLLDLKDLDYPFGFNIFSPSKSPREPTITKNRVMSVFDKEWPEASRGVFLSMILPNVTETLIEHADTMTIADIPALLLDADYRAKKVARLKNKRLKEYWRMEYDTNSASVQRSQTAPLRTRLQEWLGDPVITNIICQKNATIDFKAAIKNREIILIKLPTEEEGYEHAAPIIGTMILSQIYTATFSFADTPEERRPGFSLYIDEFQAFASPDTARLFTGGRKYKIRQTLAHQTRVQLKLPEVEIATLSANTVIALKTVLNDSRELAPLFTDIDLFPQIHIHRGDIFPHMRRHINPAVSEFWARYIRRWEEADSKEPRTRREEGYEYKILPQWNLGHGIVEYHASHVRTALSVIEEVFYLAALNKTTDEDLLSKIERGETLFSNWYTDEQLQYFVRNLRAAITALINEPVGEKQETDKRAIEDYLSHQETGHALANISTKTHAMKTFPPRSGLSPSETMQRVARIQEQTRKKYCRSREEIEAELGNTDTFNADEQPPQSITLQILARSNPDLALAQMRMDIEKLIKALYAKSVPQTAKSVRTSLTAMVHSLRKQDILDSSLTSTLIEIISAANVAVHSDVSIEPEQALPLVNKSRNAIDTLTQLLQPHEDKSTWSRFEEIDE